MPSKEPYKRLTMEIRPRLQSVNVYLTLWEPNLVSVTLNHDNFVLKIGSLKRTIDCEDFRIKPNSLTCFTNNNDEVTFRFTTDNVQQRLGSSCFELLQGSMQSCSVSDTDTFLLDGVDYTIACKVCDVMLCENIKFKRVLPLPDNLDSNDFFCHHAHGDFTLAPRKDDVLYSQCFACLNAEVLKNLDQEEDFVLKCTKCKTWIGTLQQGTCKLWFNTVVFTNNGVKHVSDPLVDCVKTVLNKGDVPLQSVRSVLKCHSNPPEEVLLLWVLEPKLKVNFTNNSGLFKGTVAKVLFKCDGVGTNLVSQWLCDLNVTTFHVSKPMLDELKEHLCKMSRYIPEEFSRSNGFCVSYVKLQSDNKKK